MGGGTLERNRKKAEAILRRLERLACGKVNDAIRLAYLTEEEIARLEELDLTALTEFKRSANGTIEIKLADRAALLERIYHLIKEEDDGSCTAFLNALGAEEDGAAC